MKIDLAPNSDGSSVAVAAEAKRRRNYLVELASPSSLSLAVTLMYLPFGLLGPLFIDTRRLGGPTSMWLLIGLVGQFVLMVTVLVGGHLASRISRVDARAAFTVLVFIAATGARGSSIAVLVNILGYTDNPEFQYRFSAAIFPQSMTLIVIALTFTHFRSNLSLVQNLENERLRLATLQASTLTRLSTYRKTLLLEVKQTLYPVTLKLQELLAPSRVVDIDRRGLLDLSQTVDSEIQSLMTNLQLDKVSSGLRRIDSPKTWTLDYAFPRRVPMRKAIVPSLSGLLVLLSAIGQSARGLSAAQSWSFVLITGIGMALLVALLRLPMMWWAPPLGLAVGVSTVVSAFSAAFVVWMQPALGLPAPTFLLIPAIGIGGLIGLFTSVYQAMNQRQMELENLIRSANDSYRANLSFLRQQMWLARRRISIVVHGAIQSTLHASILKIRLAPKVTDELIETVQTEISHAFDLLDEQQLVAPKVEQLLGDIALTWNGVVSITYSIPQDLEEIVNCSESCRWCVNEVTLEAVHNAVMHGSASEVHVVLAINEFDLIIEVIDNGVGLHESAAPGLGSQMLDEICVEWVRWRDDYGTHLKAVISSESPLRFPSDRTVALKTAR